MKVAIVGGGVTGSALALALARRGVEVVVLEAAQAPGLGAAVGPAAVLHTGFDVDPASLEGRLLARAAVLRAPLLDALGLPVLRCGAQMPHASAEALRAARASEVPHAVTGDGTLEVPGEWVTDPVALTAALAAAAERHGAEIRTGVRFEHPAQERADLYVNCAGPEAARVARAFGDDRVAIEPRRAEWVVLEAEAPAVLLSPGGVGRVVPTLDGRCVAGPARTAEEALAAAVELHPPLGAAAPGATVTGVLAHPLGRGPVVGRSEHAPELVNVAGLGHIGVSVAPALAEHVAGLIAPGAPEAPLPDAGPATSSADR
jgi:glycerol-3-phosphate dehydrogenase